MDFYIGTVLPELSTETRAAVIQQLVSIGVTENSFLPLVQERDLVPVLRPITARRLLEGWAKIFDSNASTSSGASGINISTGSEVDATASNQSAALTTTGWQYSFSVPWELFPSDLLECCQNGQIPRTTDRLQMVRVITDAILQVKKDPRRAQIEFIARSIVSKYPASFQDQFEGRIMGGGYHSLQNQIMYRIDNKRRSKKRSAGESDSAGSSSVKDALSPSHISDYGCLDWAPVVEDRSVAENQKQNLLKETTKRDRDTQKIDALMVATYPLQRQDINSNMAIAEVKENWPFLFEKNGMLAHYATLTGKSDAGSLLSYLEELSPNIYRTFSNARNISPELVREIQKIDSECEAIDNDVPKTVGFVKLLIYYFGESPSRIFRFCKETPVSLDDVPAEPFMTAHGGTLATSTEFWITIERMVVFKTVPFLKALAYQFCSFYTLNLKYPKGCCITCEFIQRYFAGINSSGTKTAKKRKSDVHPKVLWLTRIMNKK